MTNTSRLIKVKFPIFQRSQGVFCLTSDEFITTWKEVPDVLSEVKIETKNGLIRVFFDWDKHIETIKEFERLNSYYTLENLYRNVFTEQDIPQKLLNEDILEIDCFIEFTTLNGKEVLDEEYVDRIIEHYLENLLVLIFLTANISAPGCFDCFSHDLRSESGLELYEFSSSVLESARENGKEHKLFRLDRVELDTVWNWITNLELGYRQIAFNTTERALFSLLHVCKENQITPTTIIWTSLALEALYDTPKSQITKTLFRRILLFLDIKEKDKKTFRKKLYDFYNFRSRFVHGDFNINNPLSNTILEEKIWSYESEILEASYFGLSIVLATIQKMIVNNLKSIKL
ncbi:HEPN domain-containing protein [Bacillus sp. FJAT-27251]|uniref:HEPN domain-containing protein n=1 Tax=Bacillus sp. FJAT-27251 TaxID=1684142 RepID=UPI0006A7DAEF|nr:HEPN domain-containing protein [Bacillus sp. FJAT-27251]